MRHWVLLSVALALLPALPAAASDRAADDPIDSLFVKLGRGIPLESDVELDPAKTYTFEVSGEGKSTTVYQGKKSVSLFDALYCYSSGGVREPCGGKSGNDAPLFFRSTEGKTQRVWITSFEFFLGEKARGAIPANSSHVYRGSVSGWDGTFEAYSNSNICSGSGPTVKITCEGGFTIKVFGAEPKEPKLPLVVYFKATAAGKTNLNVPGAKGPGPARSEFSISGPDEVDNIKGWAHATFSRRWRNTKLLLATESKGQVVHKDFNANGTETKLTLGVVTPPDWLRKLKLDRTPETLYSPSTRRLAVLLKVKDSDDDRCPAGIPFFERDRFALLVLVPVGGVRDTATFTGFIAASKEAGPCSGHAHGWENRGTTRVRVVVRTGKPKPK